LAERCCVPGGKAPRTGGVRSAYRVLDGEPLDGLLPLADVPAEGSQRWPVDVEAWDVFASERERRRVSLSRTWGIDPPIMGLR